MKEGESYREYSRRLGLQTRDKLREMTQPETKRNEKKKECVSFDHLAITDRRNVSDEYCRCSYPGVQLVTTT